MYTFFSPLLVVFIYLFPLLWNQSQWYRSPFTPSTALSSWFLTCGLTSTSRWRRTPGCRNALRSWKRSETSCAVSWTASSSAWGVQTVRGADLRKKKKINMFQLIFLCYNCCWIQWQTGLEKPSVLWKSSLPALHLLLPRWPPGRGWPSNASSAPELGSAATSLSLVKSITKSSCNVVKERRFIFYFYFVLHFLFAVKQEFHLEEDKYYTEEEFVEEEGEEEVEDDADSTVESGSKKKSRGRGTGEPKMKMRRIFRITHGRERQRGKNR